jgi:predicted RNA methylase
MKTVAVEEDALRVLSGCQVDGNQVLITSGQLDRALYVKVDKVLKGLGGKWNSKAKAHIFPDNPLALLDQVINSGRVAPFSKNGFFPTPPEVVRELLDRADVRRDMICLEPSAGTGAIVDGLLDCAPVSIMAVENNPEIAKKLRARYPADPRVLVTEADFLNSSVQVALRAAVPFGFDRVVMNPPFELLADIKHVVAALSLLKDGGRLVSVMSSGVTFRQERVAQQFRDLVASRGGEIEPLPEGSFKASGTMVNTVMVTIEA